MAVPAIMLGGIGLIAFRRAKATKEIKALRDDPPMTDELASRFYPPFEASWRIAEMAGRAVMLLVIIATLFGLLGGGPVYLWTRTVPAEGLSVTYQPVARFGTPSGLDVTIPVTVGATEVAITLPDTIAGGFDLQSVTPRPTRWEPGDGAMRLAFSPKPNAERMIVHFGGMPPWEGWLRLSVQLDGKPPLSWSNSSSRDPYPGFYRMSTVAKAAAAYLVVLFAMRLIGRRAASQQAPFDMVMLFLVGGMTTTAILGEDRSFTAAMTGVFTVGLMHFAVSWLKLRSLTIERIVGGTPITIVHEGKWLPEEMRRLRMQRADVRTAMRQQGMIDETDLRYVIVERGGTISLIAAK